MGTWLSSLTSSPKINLREYIIEKIKVGEAFWLLPDINDELFYYLGTSPSDTILLRKKGDLQAEIIFGTNEELNKAALNGLHKEPDKYDVHSSNGLWSCKNLLTFTSEPSYLGVYEGIPKERLSFKKKSHTLQAVFLKSDKPLERKPHQGFPPPMQGFNFKF